MAKDATIAQFKQLQRNLWLRTYLMGILEFDGETQAPPQGAAARAEAMGALAGEYHEALTNASAQNLIAQLKAAADADELDEQTATELRVLAREQHESIAIPTEEAAAWSQLTSEANAVWHKAKLANDWASPTWSASLKPSSDMPAILTAPAIHTTFGLTSTNVEWTPLPTTVSFPR